MLQYGILFLLLFSGDGLAFKTGDTETSGFTIMAEVYPDKPKEVSLEVRDEQENASDHPQPDHSFSSVVNDHEDDRPRRTTPTTWLDKVRKELSEKRRTLDKVYNSGTNATSQTGDPEATELIATRMRALLRGANRQFVEAIGHNTADRNAEHESDEAEDKQNEPVGTLNTIELLDSGKNIANIANQIVRGLGQMFENGTQELLSYGKEDTPGSSAQESVGVQDNKTLKSFTAILSKLKNEDKLTLAVLKTVTSNNSNIATSKLSPQPAEVSPNKTIVGPSTVSDHTKDQIFSSANANLKSIDNGMLHKVEGRKAVPGEEDSSTNKRNIKVYGQDTTFAKQDGRKDTNKNSGKSPSPDKTRLLSLMVSKSRSGNSTVVQNIHSESSSTVSLESLQRELSAFNVVQPVRFSFGNVSFKPPSPPMSASLPSDGSRRKHPNPTGLRLNANLRDLQSENSNKLTEQSALFLGNETEALRPSEANLHTTESQVDDDLDLELNATSLLLGSDDTDLVHANLRNQFIGNGHRNVSEHGDWFENRNLSETFGNPRDFHRTEVEAEADNENGKMLKYSTDEKVPHQDDHAKTALLAFGLVLTICLLAGLAVLLDYKRKARHLKRLNRTANMRNPLGEPLVQFQLMPKESRSSNQDGTP